MALGIDFSQLLVQHQAVGVVAQRFLEDFLGLEVAAVGQVDIGFGQRIHVAGIELAGRVLHGLARHLAAAGRGVHALAAAGAEEGVRRQLAVAQRAVRACRSGFATLRNTVAAIAQKQGQQCCASQRDGRVFHQAVDKAGLFGNGDRCCHRLGRCNRCRCGRCRLGCGLCRFAFGRSWCRRGVAWLAGIGCSRLGCDWGRRRCSRISSRCEGRRCSIGGAGRGYGDCRACRWCSCSRGACCGSCGRTCRFGGCRNLA